MVMLAAALSSLRTPLGFRTNGGGSLTVRRPAPAPAPAPAPVRAPVVASVAPVRNPYAGNPIAGPLAASLLNQRSPNFSTIRSTSTRIPGPIKVPAPAPLKGTIARPVFPMDGGTLLPPIHRAPISTLAPTMAPSGGGIANAQPIVNTPPSGAPPSMSLGWGSDAATSGAGELAITTPIAGFSITQGWLVLAIILGIGVWVASD
jgi:hypothetical protein